MSAKGGPGATQTNIPGGGANNPSGSGPYGSLPDSSGTGGAYGGGHSEGCTSPIRNNRLAYTHGHSFIRKTFRTPTNCHYCTELLWGLMGQGYICEGKLVVKLIVVIHLLGLIHLTIIMIGKEVKFYFMIYL